MPSWQLVAGPASGGHSLSLTAAKSRKLSFKLTEPSELGFAINGRQLQADALDELTTDVHALWTPSTGPTRILGRWRVGNTSDDLTDTTHTVTVAGIDYRAILNNRRLYSTSQLTWTATDQAEIAWGLLQQTQTRTGGALGIVKGWTGTVPTGTIRDRTYEASDSIGERITELSQVIDGFDWDVTPTDSVGLNLGLWYPQRGTNRGVVAEFGGLVSKVRREVNTSDYANALRYTGKTDASPPLVPQELEAADLATRVEGRFDAAFGDDSLITQAALSDRAAWQLATSQVIQPTYTITLKRGAWRGPDHIWLGDPIRLIVTSGRLAVDTTLRVYQLDVTLGDAGDELIELTLGGPRPDYRRRPSLVERRLNNLERR